MDYTVEFAAPFEGRAIRDLFTLGIALTFNDKKK
jgi:hypothetical protein